MFQITIELKLYLRLFIVYCISSYNVLLSLLISVLDSNGLVVVKFYFELCWWNIFWGICRWLVEIIRMLDITVLNFLLLLHLMRVLVKRYNDETALSIMFFVYSCVHCLWVDNLFWLNLKYSVTAMYVIQLLHVSTGPGSGPGLQINRIHIMMLHIVMLIAIGRRRGMSINV